MSNALFYMFSFSFRTNMNFDEAGIAGERTMEFLTEEIADPLMLEIIDSKITILGPIFIAHKERCLDSTLNYLEALMLQFTIVYSGFVVTMTFIIVLFLTKGFNILRQNMWNTNVLVKMIPFDQLEESSKEEMK